MKLSRTQSGLLDAIREKVERDGFPPTLRELQAACGISSSAVVSYNLKKLKNQGLIDREPRIARSIVLTERGEAMTETKGSTAVANRETVLEEPTIKAIIAPPGNFSTYMNKLLDATADRIETAKRKVATAEAWEDSDAIREAEEGVAAAERLEGNEGISQLWRWSNELKTRRRSKKIRLARAKRELTRGLAMKDALEMGYVPLPRMPAVNMEYVYQAMPPDVLDAFTEAKEVGVFEEFRVIDGREATRYGRPVGAAHSNRDPILIGMIDGEMFAVAWWR